MPIKRIKTGLVRFDEMLGGGIPEGCRMEIFGREDCGKSTFALEISKAFKKPFLIDFEHKMDEEYAQVINPAISEEQGSFIRGITLEESLDEFLRKFKDIVKRNIERKKKKKPLIRNYDLLIIDTVGSASTLELMEAELSDKKRVGSLARVMKDFLKNKAEKILTPYGCVTLMLNHKLQKIGAKPFEEQTYTPGGMQISFSSVIRLAMGRKSNRIYDDAITATFWQKKNHTTKQDTRSGDEVVNCEYIIRRGNGVVRGFEAMQIGIEIGVIQASGPNFTIGNETFRGQKEMIKFLEDNKDVMDAILEAYYE